VRERDDLPATVSHEAVRAILAGYRSSWHKLESVIRQLAAWSVVELDVTAALQNIHKLWITAADADPVESMESIKSVEPVVRSASPAVFRQAVRGLHGPTDMDAIDAFMSTTVRVPLAFEGALLIASTPTEGLWVCVFTGIDRLHACERVIGALQAADWTPILGRELVRLVSGLDIRLGILVDPPATSDQDVNETLPVPDGLVAELAAGLS
jgi:hypothetical protein